MTKPFPAKKLRAAACVFAAALLVLTACSTEGGGNSDKGQHLTVGQVGDIVDFNPFKLLLVNYSFINNLYETPLLYDKDLKPQPVLAESWDIDPDGKSITLHLRNGVKFHSGAELTSADVAYSIEYAKDAKNAANVRKFAAQVQTVETPDKQTITLRYAKPNPSILDFLNLLYIVPKSSDGGFVKTGDGTGPFTLDSFQPGNQVVLQRNDAYWGAKPALDKVSIKILPDEQAALAQIESGSIDMLVDVSPQGFKTAKDTPGLKSGLAGDGQLYLHFEVNVTKPPLDNIHVRKALSLALDRERIATEVLGDKSKAACLPYPSWSLAYDADLASSCTFDLDAAKKELALAGLSSLNLTIQETAGNLSYSQMSQIFQSDLAKIGVTVKIDELQNVQFAKNRTDGAYQLEAHLYGRAGVDPSSLFGSSNSWQPPKPASGFNTPEYSQLIEKAATTVDESQRKALYKQLGELILEQNFSLQVANSPSRWLAGKSVQGLGFTVDGIQLLGGVRKN